MEAIAECQGSRNPNANTCVKLAAYYTILDHISDKNMSEPRILPYSLASAPVDTNTIKYNSDTEFSWAISGKDPDMVWPVIDEMMSVLQVTQPRLYDGVMRKLRE